MLLVRKRVWNSCFQAAEWRAPFRYSNFEIAGFLWTQELFSGWRGESLFQMFKLVLMYLGRKIAVPHFIANLSCQPPHDSCREQHALVRSVVKAPATESASSPESLPMRVVVNLVSGFVRYTVFNFPHNRCRQGQCSIIWFILSIFDRPFGLYSKYCTTQCK